MYFVVGDNGDITMYYLDTLITIGDSAMTANGFVACKTIHGESDETVSLKDYYSGGCIEHLKQVILQNYDKTLGEEESYKKLTRHEWIENGETKYSNGYSKEKLEKLGIPLWYIKQSSHIVVMGGEDGKEEIPSPVEICNDEETIMDFSDTNYEKWLHEAVEKAVIDAATNELNKYSAATVCDFETVCN